MVYFLDRDISGEGQATFTGTFAIDHVVVQITTPALDTNFLSDDSPRAVSRFGWVAFGLLSTEQTLGEIVSWYDRHWIAWELDQWVPLPWQGWGYVYDHVRWHIAFGGEAHIVGST